MRVLVLGGTSFTGPFLVRRLSALGHEVTVFHRGRHTADLPPSVDRIEGSLTDPPRELRALKPDLVIHTWALTEADAHRFLELFAGAARRAIVISSGDVYRAYGRLQRLESGPPDPGPLTEDAPLRESRYPYRGKTGLETDTGNYDKILVEQALLAQQSLPATIIRYPAVYGPGDPFHRFRPWLEQMAAALEPLAGRRCASGEPSCMQSSATGEIRLQEDFAGWRWTHGYVEDVAEAVVLAAVHERATGRIYNAGELHTPTVYERLEQLAKVAGWTGRFVAAAASDIPEERRLNLDFAHDLVMDSSRIREDLGYSEVTPTDEAWRRTIRC